MLPSPQAQDHTAALLKHLRALLARPAFPWVLDALRACTELVQRNTSETGLAIWLEFSWEEYCSFFLQVGSVGSGETKDGVVTAVDGTTDDRDFGRLKEAFYYVFTSYINAINTNNPGRPNSSPSDIVFLLFKTILVTLEEDSGGESEVGSANASTASMPVRFNECLMQELKKSEVDVVLQDFDDNGSHPGINAISTHIAPAHAHPIFPNLNIHECTTDTLRNELNNFLLAAWYHAWPPSQYISSLPPPWDDISSHTTDYVDTSLLPRCTRLCDPETMDDKTVLMFCMHFVLMREMKTSLNLGQNGSDDTDVPVYVGFRFKTKYQIFVAQLARGFYSTTNSGVKPESDGNILNADSIDNTFQHYLRANAVRVHDEDNANADAMTIDEEEFEVDETLMDISSSQSTAIMSSMADADVQEIAAWTGTAERNTLGDLRGSTRHKSSSSDQPEYHRSLASARDEDSSNESKSAAVRNTNTAGSAEVRTRTRTRTPGTPARSSPRRRSANNYSADTMASANDVSRAANGHGDGSATATATVSRSSAISLTGSAESESESRETRKTKEKEFETKSSSATSSNSSKTRSQPRTQTRTRAQTRSRTQTRSRGTSTGINIGETQDPQKSLSSISACLRGKKTLLYPGSALPGSSRGRSAPKNTRASGISASRKNLHAMGGRASRSMSGSIASRLRKR